MVPTLHYRIQGIVGIRDHIGKMFEELKNKGPYGIRASWWQNTKNYNVKLRLRRQQGKPLLKYKATLWNECDCRDGPKEIVPDRTFYLIVKSSFNCWTMIIGCGGTLGWFLATGTCWQRRQWLGSAGPQTQSWGSWLSWASPRGLSGPSRQCPRWSGGCAPQPRWLQPQRRSQHWPQTMRQGREQPIKMRGFIK